MVVEKESAKEHNKYLKEQKKLDKAVVKKKEAKTPRKSGVIM